MVLDLLKILAVVTGLTFVVSLVAAWITHIVWTVTGLMTGSLDTWGEAVLAVLGVLIPFVGTIHGYVLWFN